MNGKNRRGTGATLLEFLGSMNLAITLLVAISIAAIIGTVLQQNQPYNDYVIKFGPFWFEVFKSLGLYDVYSTPWFLLLLGFLLISTAVCVVRQSPGILRDMRQFRLDVQDKSLRGFRNHAEWADGEPPEAVAQRMSASLSTAGYRVRRKADEETITLGAMKGATGRLGYLLSHTAIVVICVGALLDGNLPLKFAEYLGRIAPETRDLPVSEIPEKSVLSADNNSFRGSVTIPEGSSADFVFLGLRNGYLLQQLPFQIALEDFRIEHYSSGQPKSFESDLLIFDDDLAEPLRQTIAVNHPLIYKGYAIYQSSFSDGGSRLTMKAWPFDLPGQEPLVLEGRIGEQLKLNTPRGPRTIELSDYKPLNVFPVDEKETGKRFHNYGPSVVFKLRDGGGQAREYVNYMAPLPMDGQLFFLTGMRESQAEDYRFLHIPLDSEGTIDRFMRFRARALDGERLAAVVAEQVGEMAGTDSPITPEQLSASITSLVRVFAEEGIDAVVAQAEQTSPNGETEAALEAYIKVIQNALAALYVDLLAEEGVDLEQGVDPAQQRFFEASMNALSLIGPYGSPFALQLTNVQQIEASGLQITKSPGKDIVYLGCVMLMVGVFFMFYLHHRRLWVRVTATSEGATKILFAGAGHRDGTGFTEEFEALSARLRHTGGAPAAE